MSEEAMQLTLFGGPEKVEQTKSAFDVSGIIREIRKIPHESMTVAELARVLNDVRRELHEISPFRMEPVDFVEWVASDGVEANDYNPNSVAPPEMELLRHSINHDGYTQPVVTWKNGDGREVVDGFHRTRVCKEHDDVRKRVHGHLPVVTVKAGCTDRSDRIAATIRHNRARGKHGVDSMADIVVELKRRNWTDNRISKELGMDSDEILRLCQVTGLADAFSGQEFSQSWEIGDGNDDGWTLEFSDDEAPTVTVDDSRIYHTWDKWECQRAGFYLSKLPGGVEDGELAYRDFLADCDRFREAAMSVIAEWKHSCEHYLSNDKMNRIAWIGQAAMCYATGVPAKYRAGYHLLGDLQKIAADNVALDVLNEWLIANGREVVTMEAATGKTKADLY